MASFHQSQMSSPKVHSPTVHAESKTAITDEIKDPEVDLTPYDSESEFAFTDKEKKKIVRRIDLRIVCLLGAMYATSLVDRTNIGIAYITGMGADLRLTGTRYNLINAVFFGPYILLQVPATIVLRKVGPRSFLCSTTVLWGLATLACGFVRTWYDLVALRMVLGVCEAAFFPGCAYLLSVWYPRYDLQKRYAIWNILGTIPAAFSGIFSYGISHLAGRGTGPEWWSQHRVVKGSLEATTGVAGWRYIFWVYGAVTCAIGIASWVLVVDFSEKIVMGTSKQVVPFLSKLEAEWAVERIQKDRKDAMPPEFRLGEYLKHAGDWKIWAYGLCYGCMSGPMYAIGFALPFILSEGMHFSQGASQCLSTPPFLLGACATIIVAYYSDKLRVRTPFIVFNCCIIIVGLCLTGFTHTVGVRYFGVFVAACGGGANGPCIMTWQSNNIRGQWKRVMSSAVLSVFSALGGVTGSFMFRTQDGPYYHPGIGACIGMTVLILVLVLFMDLVFIRANKRAAAGGELIEGLEGFRYTL